MNTLGAAFKSHKRRVVWNRDGMELREIGTGRHKLGMEYDIINYVVQSNKKVSGQAKII